MLPYAAIRSMFDRNSMIKSQVYLNLFIRASTTASKAAKNPAPENSRITTSFIYQKYWEYPFAVRVNILLLYCCCVMKARNRRVCRASAILRLARRVP